MGTLRLIATGIGTSPALKGNILGPILFLLVFNVPHILVRWCFTRWGYVLGTGVLQRIQKSGMMESLTYGASIIGLMVVGAMTASMIDITIPLSFGAGEAKTGTGHYQRHSALHAAVGEFWHRLLATGTES